MSIAAFQGLACPLDGEPLQCHGSRWACTAGHSFDIARQGYTNLLPVQHKRSRDPGDSKEMVTARRRFLQAGYYERVAAAVSQLALADLPHTTTAACLDAGCGEGYYLRQLAAAGAKLPLSLLGLDISKWAVQSAAKQDQRPNWVVGSNARLPVQTGSLDRVLSVFGFPVFPEFARVLKPNGRILLVDPGPEHLRELREIIYPRMKSADSAVGVEAPEGTRVQSRQTLVYSVALTGQEQIADLLSMTPHLYRAGAEGRAQAAALNTLTITVDVRLTSLVRS